MLIKVITGSSFSFLFFHTVLVKGHDDQRVLHELLVALHRVDEVLEVGFSVGDVGVVGVVLQGRSIVHVLGSVFALGNICGKMLFGIDDVLAASSIFTDIVKGHERVVLAVSHMISDWPNLVGSRSDFEREKFDLPDVARGLILVQGIASTTSQRIVALHISPPRDTGRLKNINQVTLSSVVVGIVIDAGRGGRRNHRDVVWLRWMCGS